MEFKVTKREVITEMWVASDGEEFLSQSDCERHERYVRREAAIERIRELNLHYPDTMSSPLYCYIDQDYYDSSWYIHALRATDEAIELIKELGPGCEDTANYMADYKGQVVFVSINQDCYDTMFCGTISDIVTSLEDDLRWMKDLAEKVKEI